MTVNGSYFSHYSRPYDEELSIMLDPENTKENKIWVPAFKEFAF